MKVESVSLGLMGEDAEGWQASITDKKERSKTNYD